MAERIAVFAAAFAAVSFAPVYGPDHASTGTGLTGCIPYGNCNPVVNDIFYYLVIWCRCDVP